MELVDQAVNVYRRDGAEHGVMLLNVMLEEHGAGMIRLLVDAKADVDKQDEDE